MRRHPFLTLFALGFLGVLSLLPASIPAIARMPLPADSPPGSVIVLLSILQPTILVGLAVAIGLSFASRLGFRSYVVDATKGRGLVWPGLRRDAPLAVAVGAAAMMIVVALDVAFRPFMGDAWQRFEQPQDTANLVGALVMGMLYGGITEEILLRWGMLSFLAWLGWRFGGRTAEVALRPSVAWIAIVVTAILFGVGHLPAVSAMVPLTPVVVARTVLLNALAGIAFGWLFWRRSLEAAMIAHATGHVVLFVVKLVTR
jgi:membrane protease YdiL (CAAX protease family)